ncbi:helix-turn-helix domain-containing protein [Streptomyces sp. NPDC050085]|uniref:nSTAND1 domain-containing NTPase n=1 Tax=Streptomyces sp. NPDC050085 TaxID=3365600 RepID=UPI00378C048C
MGRRETPVDPSAGPVQRFAYELRKLRQEAGGVTYRELARRAHYSVTALSQAAAGEQLPSLQVTLAYARACGADEQEWEERWQEADCEVRNSAVHEGDDAEAPYQGLARFEPGDHERYFGRDRLVATLRQQVRDHAFSALFGPSGSGKSSLLRAGLVPALRAEREVAAIRILTPGEHPARTHAAALRPGPAGDTVVVVDQFEEVFTLCRDADERRKFIDLLLTARAPSSGLRVVLAVRADFYGRCAEHRGLADALGEAGLLVGPMDPDELREVIVKPAQAEGLIVERALTARLVAETAGEPGGLPLLSHVLRETWRRRRGRALTEEAYEAAGGLHGAIAQTAEDVYAGLTAEHARLARLVLLRLIVPGEGAQDTRRPVDRSELDFTPGAPAATSDAPAPFAAADVSSVVDRLARARLISLDHGTVDLAHEALITAWPRLSGWIDEDREQLRVHRRLTEAARTWDELGRDAGALYRGTRLAAAREQLSGASLTPLERAFLDASSAALQGERRRRRGLLGTLAVLVVLALVAGAVAWQQGRTSDRRRVEAEARRGAGVADSMRFSDPVTAMRLSVAAWRLADTTETRSALIGAMAQREQDVFAVPGADVGFDRSGNEARRLTADGRSVVSVTRDRVRIWDLRTRRLTLSAPGPGKLMDDGTSPVVGADGRTLALPIAEVGVKLWDVRSARVTRTLSRAEQWEDEVAFDEHVLAATDAENGDINVWDLPSGRRTSRMAASEEIGAVLAVSPDGRWLARCAAGHLGVWDLAHHRKTSAPWAAKARTGDCSSAHALAFAPDSRSLAVVVDGGIRGWDLRTGRETLTLKAEGLTQVRFDSRGEFLVTTGPGQLLVWRASFPYIPVLQQPLTEGDGTDVALDRAAGTVRYLNASGTVVRSLSLGRTLTKAWSPHMAQRAELSGDGRVLARVTGTENSKRVQVLDTRDGRVVFAPEAVTCPGEEDETICTAPIALSGDGRYLARIQREDSHRKSSPGRTRVAVWDVRTGRVYATMSIRPDREDSYTVTALALDTHAHTLLVYRPALRPTVEVWDVRRERHVKTVRSSRADDGVTESDSARLALRSDNGRMVTEEGLVADLRKGNMEPRVLGDEMISFAAFSPDGTRLAVGDALGRVTLWDGESRTRIGVLDGSLPQIGTDFTGPVSALAFSHDGHTLAVASETGPLQLWDVPSQRLFGTALPTPGDPVLALSFGSDDGTLYASGTNVPVQKYDITPAHLAARVCERVGSGLSARDWRTYLPNVPYRHTC